MGCALRNAALTDFDNEQSLAAPRLPVDSDDSKRKMAAGLGPRVDKLENDAAVISQNLTILTVRSENFATHADAANIRTEITATRGELKEEIANVRGELKEEIANVRGELKEEMASMRGELKEEMASMRGEFHETLQKTINKQTVMLLTILPATLAAIATIAAWFK